MFKRNYRAPYIVPDKVDRFALAVRTFTMAWPWRVTIPGERMIGTRLTGTLRVFHLFDIAEGTDLNQLHSIFGTRPSRREPAFRHPAPEYVRFERPPVWSPSNPV